MAVSVGLAGVGVTGTLQGQMDRQMDGWMEGWIDGWMSGLCYQADLCVSVLAWPVEAWKQDVRRSDESCSASHNQMNALH